MTGIRRHLAWLICGWLACQVVGVVAAPVMLWRVVVAHTEEACDCPIAPGAACPMHKSQQHHDDASTCKMRNAFPNPDQALSGLAGGYGVLPVSTVAVSAFEPGVAVSTMTPFAIARAYLPEAPPPRG